jgi:signal transduction histidine kinase
MISSSDDILRGQRAVLAELAAGASLREVLSSIARYSEESTPSMLASILFYEPESGRLRRGGHHTLPDAFADTVDGLEPGPVAGSCGTAAFRRARVVSFDVQEDPLWSAFREFAASHGIRSAWSTPLLSPVDGSLLGVFGMYYGDTRAPSEADLERVDHFTHLAAIAIERHRRDQALRESERQRHQALLATVAGLAHELNTPLGIALTAESLLDEGLGELGGSAADERIDRVREAATMMRTQVTRATELIRSFKHSVLEQSHDESREVVVSELARALIEGLRPLLAERRLQVELVDQSSGALVRCSPARLGQVVTNLVVNAATHAYGPEGGGLTVLLAPSRLTPDRLELVFRDEGRGMDAEERRRCTEPFYTTKRSAGGAGLGLFLAKHVVEAELKGTLLLDTEPGRGVRWTVVLPTIPGGHEVS